MNAMLEANDTVLEVRDVRKSYGSLVAVDGVSFDVFRSECFGLLGPNGAGKTTLIEICQGLKDADSGKVTLFGRKWADDRRRLRAQVGVLMQETALPDKLTVEEVLEVFRSFYDESPSVSDLIAVTQLEEKRKARVGRLSGGQKQRLAMACALAGDPRILFLDEPSTGLDPQSRQEAWRLVKALQMDGRTVVLTTHYMDEAEHLCDRVAVVDHGRIIAIGPPRALIEQLRSEHIIEFAVDDMGRVRATDFENLAGVVTSVERNGAFSLQVREIHTAVPSLIRYLSEQQVSLTELRTHSASLEDVFVSLTGRTLRDA